ncbi:PQ loop repeat [Geosmithia morbida]|uniref:PQ loop repeat n=1 Tax=Geosmithia morbida TaxID=1094350 RepID=A0A9P4YNJ5_9HYPO|nr:PQ loop repeat [Geosmithia morbida]KAF4120233.1 PQ loop repeat [Geosmithia morbida]
MGWLTSLTGVLAPVFIVFSPFLSYGDQALSMRRNKSSAGFSLDIPLIMLVASLLRIFYWPGARFDTSLLVQSIFMVMMQLALLKIALDHRPPPSTRGGDGSLPFSGSSKDGGMMGAMQRPYNFWQWRSPKPYWQFLSYMFLGLVVCEVVLRFVPPVYGLYSSLIGITGLSVEATLPLPQVLSNARTRSTVGLRLSVLASWLGGDAMKMFWFFTSTSEIPATFKLCGSFQAMCDCFLALQFFMYRRSATAVAEDIKDHPLTSLDSSAASHGSHDGLTHPHSVSLTPTHRPAHAHGSIDGLKDEVAL